MKFTSKLIVLIVAILAIAFEVHAQVQPMPTPINVRGISTEQAGDEALAAGNYDGAIFYFRIQVAWLLGQHGSNDAATLAVRERLAGKMAIALPKVTKPPEVSEKAEFHATKGAAFVKLAKTPADFSKAVAEFEQAVLLAPWKFDYHFNLAVAYKSAGQFKFALDSANLAKLLALNDKDRRDVNALRAEIEAAQEMAASANAEVEKAAQASRTATDAIERERLIPTVAGSWTWANISFQVVRDGERFTIVGGTMLGINPPVTWHAANLVADRQHLRFKGQHDNPGVSMNTFELTLSPSGKELTGYFLENRYPVTFTRVP